MIFVRLQITNMGVYRGRQEFELRPQMRDGETPPIVLFGGKNGAGKSTILEAIRLCLYGRTALGTRVRRADYETYIRQRMHRQAGGGAAPTASVGLVFEHTHAGVLSTYDAVRAWRVDGTTVQESVSIYKDGALFQAIAPEHWSDFLRDLIPPGLADLFFFDGEQIQALADEERETETLANAVRGLLNFDLVDRLRSDLSMYLRQQDIRDRSQLQQAAEQAEASYQTLQERVGARRQDLAGLQSQLDRTLALIEKARQALLREGAAFVHRRDEIEQRQKEIVQSLEQTREAMRELAAGLLPFAVTPQWTQRLRTRLLDEAQAEQARNVFAAQAEMAAHAALTLLQPSFQQGAAPQVEPQTWAQIAEAVQRVLTPPPVDDIGATRHPVSTSERTTLLRWIEESTTSIPQRLAALGAQLEALEREQERLEMAAKQIPSEAIAAPLLDGFHHAVEDKARLDLHFAQTAEDVRLLEFQLGQLDRERLAAWERLAAAGDGDLRVQRAARAQVVLDQYLRQITALKMDELEQAIAHYFNLLCRKQMLVREVKIDAQRFVVTLYGKNRVELPKSDLSAGEKQLYATALLWALRAVSGRALPIIIDTPMGRLDSDHRSTMLRDFFPNAAHQVILLSTDSEIDPQAFGSIQHAVSHTFRLEFDQQEGCTHVQRGYFELAEETA